MLEESSDWLKKKGTWIPMGKTQSVTSCWLKSIYWCDQSIVLIGHRHCVKKIIYRSSYIYRVGQPIGHHCTVGGSYTLCITQVFFLSLGSAQWAPLCVRRSSLHPFFIISLCEPQRGGGAAKKGKMHLIIFFKPPALLPRWCAELES